MLSDEYAAGFFDGEGCVSISYQQPPGKRRTHRLVVSVSQIGRELPDLYAARFGGIVSPCQVVGNRRQCFAWQASSRVAEAFLRTVVPHLVVKREQAELALRFRTLFGPEHGTMGRGNHASDELVSHREACREELLALNKRGARA